MGKSVDGMKKWHNTNNRGINIKLNIETDKDILDYWASLPKNQKANIFRQMVREKIEKEKEA